MEYLCEYLCYYLAEICCYLDGIVIISPVSPLNPFIWKPTC